MKLTTQERVDVTALAIGLAFLLFLAGLLLAPQYATAAQQLPPCESEDYSGPVACYWDAQQRGNHIGQSFTWTGSQVVHDSK